MIGLWIYIIGYVLVWRYSVGYFMQDFPNPDGEDVIGCLLIGSAINLLWPALIVGRWFNIAWKKWGVDRTNSLATIFPAPKEIESNKEKQERLERERRHEIGVQRTAINRREEELGLELTKW